MNRKKLVTEMGRIDRDAFSVAEKLPLVIVLDNVRSLHNVGAVFRTSDAFRIECIMLCGITATPPSAEIPPVSSKNPAIIPLSRPFSARKSPK